MENNKLILKAIADDTRLEIIKLLLEHYYCVGALAQHLALTESAISQHLKVLREAGLLIGEKHGHFMHYDVNRVELTALAAEFVKLASIQRNACKPEEENCIQGGQGSCLMHENGNICSEEVIISCHGIETESKECSK
jgi:ArsR family transcriptional regulator, arsenate/arsenite/antimonite-responsive transcriptional repressor